METNENEKEFYHQIEQELNYCDSSVTPLICANMQTPESKMKLIAAIAKTSLDGRIDIAKAIVEVERLYSANDID